MAQRMKKTHHFMSRTAVVTSCVAMMAFAVVPVSGAATAARVRHGASLPAYLAQRSIHSTPLRHSHSSSTVTWTPHSINTPSGGMNAVSCLSASFCVAVDNGGDATTFNGSVWSSPVSIDGTTSLDAISCATTTFCVATDANGNYIFDNSGVWATPTPFNAVHPLTVVALSISCPSTTYCLALGATFSASNSVPTAMFWDNGTWFTTATSLTGDVYSAVSCVTRSFCMGVTYQGDYVKYAAPTSSGGTELASASSAVAIDAVDFISSVTSVSCPTATFCAAGDGFGDLLVYSASTWHNTSFIFNYASSSYVSCSTVAAGDVSGTNCIAMDDAGETARLSGLTWIYGDAGDPNDSVTGLSCVSDNFCIAVDYDGFALSVTETLATSSLKTNALTSQVFDQPNNVTTSSCGNATSCLAGDAAGNIYLYNGTSWTLQQKLIAGVPFGVKAISCNESSNQLDCIILDNNGDQYWYFNGTTSQPINGSVTTTTVAAASCSAAPYCLVVDQNFVADHFTSLNSYSAATLPSSDVAGASPVAASCVADLSRCVVIDSDGYAYISVAGGAWTKTSRFVGDPANETASAISCPTANFCAAADDFGNAYFLNGTTWSKAHFVGGAGFRAISCSSSYRCVAVDSGGDAFLYDGTGWTHSVQVASTGDFLNSVSCEIGQNCVATDSNNSFTLSSTPTATTTSIPVIATSMRTASHLVVSAKVTGVASPNGVVTITRAATSCDAHLSPIAGTKSSQGSCQLPAPDIIGTVHLSAHYQGSFNFLGSSATAVSQVLSESSTTTLTLSSSSTTLGHEQTEKFKTVVAPQHAGIVATGTVTIYAGSQHLCTLTLAMGSGTCSPKASALSRGSHKIVAVYNGTKVLLSSSSTSRTLNVK
jgi:hypothetical protein